MLLQQSNLLEEKMEQQAIQTIDILNAKFGHILCTIVDQQLSNSDKNALLQLTFHIREVNNALDNVLASRYMGDNNLTALHSELLETKLCAALEYLNQLV